MRPMPAVAPTLMLEPVTQEIVWPTVMLTGEPPKVVVSIRMRCGLPAQVGAVEPEGNVLVAWRFRRTGKDGCW